MPDICYGIIGLCCTMTIIAPIIAFFLMRMATKEDILFHRDGM